MDGGSRGPGSDGRLPSMAGTAPVTRKTTPARARTQRGLALPLLLLLLLALTLLAHGTLLLAQREFMASKAFFHATRATLAARSALVASIDPRLSVGGPGPPLSHPSIPDFRWVVPECWGSPPVFLGSGWMMDCGGEPLSAGWGASFSFWRGRGGAGVGLESEEWVLSDG